jgi:hypothetical protein
MAPRDSAGQETEAPGGARTTGKLCGEAVLSGSAASVAYLVMAVFFGGCAFGVVAMVAMVAVAVRKEDRQFSLSAAAPGAMARGARRLTGFGGAGSHFQPRSRA